MLPMMIVGSVIGIPLGIIFTIWWARKLIREDEERKMNEERERRRRAKRPNGMLY